MESKLTDRVDRHCDDDDDDMSVVASHRICFFCHITVRVDKNPRFLYFPGKLLLLPQIVRECIKKKSEGCGCGVKTVLLNSPVAARVSPVVSPGMGLSHAYMYVVTSTIIFPVTVNNCFPYVE